MRETGRSWCRGSGTLLGLYRPPRFVKFGRASSLPSATGPIGPLRSATRRTSPGTEPAGRSDSQRDSRRRYLRSNNCRPASRERGSRARKNSRSSERQSKGCTVMAPLAQGPPSIRVGRAHAECTTLRASPWLLRQKRFGLQLLWTREVPYRPPRPYQLSRNDAAFGHGEVTSWLERGLVRPAKPSEVDAMKRAGLIFPAFVTRSAGKDGLVIDYKRDNECMEARNFRMDKLSDLASVRRRGDHLFKSKNKVGYYHLHQRPEDGLRLAFFRRKPHIRAYMSELRVGRRTVVLHQGHGACCRVP